jgi:ferrous-iron efflux pump FieF
MAFSKMQSSHQIEYSIIAIQVLSIASLLLICFTLFQTFVLSKHNSQLIKADRMHYITDVFVNLSVILSMWLGDYTNSTIIDPIAGICIAIYIINGSYRLIQETYKNLIDEEFSEDEKNLIIKMLSKYKEIKAIHELKTRRAWNKSFVQFHAEMPAKMTIIDSHYIIDKIEQKTPPDI